MGNIEEQLDSVKDEVDKLKEKLKELEIRHNELVENIKVHCFEEPSYTTKLKLLPKVNQAFSNKINEEILMKLKIKSVDHKDQESIIELEGIEFFQIFESQILLAAKNYKFQTLDLKGKAFTIKITNWS